MKGSVTKYGIKGSSRPRWRYRVCIGKAANGKYLYEGAAGFEKQGAAEDAARAHIERLRASAPAAALAAEPITAADPTLGEWLRTWLDTYATNRCQPKTLERYRQLANYVLIGPAPELTALSAVPLPAISHKQLEPGLYALLQAKGKRRDHISARTVRHVAGVLHVSLNKAFRLDLIAVNPMLKVELPPVEKQDARSLTPEEIKKLRDACRGDWTFALVEVALATAARRGELLALEWTDIDWAAKAISITKSLEQTAAGLRVKSTKSKKPRHFTLPKSAIAALQFQRDQQVEHQRLFAADYHDHKLIFCQPNGDYLLPDLVSQVIVRRIQKAGIQDASLHTLRHSHASHLLSRGVPLPLVSERLGHADVNVTARIYAHALPSDDQRAADEWDGVIDGPIQ